MKCFELSEDGRALSGIPADAHQGLDDRIVTGGRILNAGILRLPLMGMSTPAFPIHSVWDNEFGSLFCTLHLLHEEDQASDFNPPKGSILLRLNLQTCTCDPEYGDESKLLSWTRQYGLFLCTPGLTAVRNPGKGTVHVLNGLRLELHRNPEKLRLDVARSNTFRRMKESRHYLPVLTE